MAKSGRIRWPDPNFDMSAWVAASRAKQGLGPTIEDVAQARQLARMDVRMGRAAPEPEGDG